MSISSLLDSPGSKIMLFGVSESYTRHQAALGIYLTELYVGIHESVSVRGRCNIILGACKVPTYEPYVLFETCKKNN